MIPKEVAELFSLLIKPEQSELDRQFENAIETIARRAAARGSLASGNTLVAVVNEAGLSFEARASAALAAFRRSCEAFGIHFSSKLSAETLSLLDAFLVGETSKLEDILRNSAVFRSVSAPSAHEAAMRILADKVALQTARLKAEVTLAAITGDREMLG